MEQINELSLAKMVLLKPSAAAVLERHHLDFCCKGKQTLQEALAHNQALYAEVHNELEELFNKNGQNETNNFEAYSLTDLADYIIGKHHKYVKEILPVLFIHTQKIADKHGDRHPELIKIAANFTQIKMEFEQHLMKEEEILFPRIKMIEEIHIGKRDKSEMLSISGPVQMMMAEHENAGRLTHEIMELTDNYVPPGDACTTYKIAFMELQEFELDLHQHVHLENNILFPKAIEMMNN